MPYFLYLFFCYKQKVIKKSFLHLPESSATKLHLFKYLRKYRSLVLVWHTICIKDRIVHQRLFKIKLKVKGGVCLSESPSICRSSCLQEGNRGTKTEY